MAKALDLTSAVAQSPTVVTARRHLEALAVVPDADGPRIRLGIAWAVLTTLWMAVGPVALGLWLALAALFAAGQATRSWRRQERRPVPAVAVFGAAAVPLAATQGLAGAAAAAALVGVVGLAWEPASGILRRPPVADVRRDPMLTVGIGAGFGLAAASPVAVLTQLGVVEAIVLLAVVFVYDASAYVVGAGAANAWEGPAAGAAFIAALTLLVAGLFVPPFRGASPWLLGLLSILLAPAGPYAATALVGDREQRVPAVRRLDSLLVLGPVWALAAVPLVD